MLTILFDGIAYGMLLFMLAVRAGGDDGADELHQPGARRLRHGRRLHRGLLMQRATACRSWRACRWPSSVAALLGAVLERTLYRPLYGKPHLDQVLFSIGLVVHGGRGGGLLHRLDAADHAAARVPAAGASRSAAASGMGAVPAVHHRRLRRAGARRCRRCCRSTRFGSRLRAAVDDPRVASGLGINVNRVFLVTFAFGSGPRRPGRRARRRDPRPRPDLPAQVHDLFPDRRRGRRHHVRSPARCWRRCCWASPTWRASTTSPSWAPSSSTA